MRPPPKPIRWNVYKLASKAVWLGEVEAQDEARRETFYPFDQNAPVPGAIEHHDFSRLWQLLPKPL